MCKALNDACDKSPPRLLRNPAARLHKLPDSPEQQTWTPVQLRRFFAHSAEDRWLALWQFIADSAMRRGEVAGLRWPDLDLEAAAVRLATQRAKGGGTVRRQRLKRKRGRRVHLDVGTVAGLKAWRKQQAAEQFAWPGEWGNDEQLVFRALQLDAASDLGFCKSGCGDLNPGSPVPQTKGAVPADCGPSPLIPG